MFKLIKPISGFTKEYGFKSNLIIRNINNQLHKNKTNNIIEQIRLNHNFNFKKQFNNHTLITNSTSSTIGIGIILGGGILGIFLNHIINNYNDKSTILNEIHSVNNSIHELKPIQTADTYENGLFEASQREEYELFSELRNNKTSRGNYFKRIFYMIKFKIDDYIIDPIVTITRFIELTMIFVPLLLSAPICWFGSKSRSHINSTSISNLNSKSDSKKSDKSKSKSKSSTNYEETRSGAKLWFRYLRWSAELAGASFIKLGQWAASRTDIFPRELCNQLGDLHSNAKPHSIKATKKILSSSFNMNFEEIFDEFNEKPVGVGAIAQVYIGKLSKKSIERSHAQANNEEIELSLDPEKQNNYGENDKNNGIKSQNFLDKIIVTEHYGESLTSNQQVAIKVLHPNVEVKINRDLKIMKFFANIINVIPTMEWLSLPDEVEQFSILMRLQLDLRIEGLNLSKFRYNFKNRLDIHFPKPYMNFTSRNVLVEQYIHAIPMSKLLSLNENFGKNLSKEVSDKGLDAFLKMLLLDNFVHADLHPGNMMIRFYKNELFKHEKEYKIVKSSNEQDINKITNELLSLGDDLNKWCERLSQLYQEGYHAEICFLDVGLITELNQTDRINFIDLFKSLSEFDGYKAGELMIERSRTPHTAINKEIFAIKVEKLVDRMKERTFTLGNISIGDLLDQVLGMVRSHHVRMEGDFITVIVAILLLEGIGRQLDPNLDLFARFVYALMIGFPTENDISLLFV